MEKIEKIEVFVNGEKLAAKSRQTIGEFLASLGFKPERCVVEVNLKAKKYAEDKNAFFKLVSAKADPDGINNLFNILLDKLIKTKPDFDLSRRASFVVNKSKHNSKEKKCC